MGLRPLGIHGNNYPSIDSSDLDIIYNINPSVILLCQDDFHLVPEIKKRIPDITIIGRVFGDYALGWDSWHIIEESDPNKLYAYGLWAGRIANQWEIDILQTVNEPGIDNGDSFWFTESGYEKIRDHYAHIIAGIRSVSKVLIGTIPLSPGHNEDDNPNNFSKPGGEILKPTFDLCDVWLFHNYWSAAEKGSELSQWSGQRNIRQRDVYRVSESGKPWYISEWNRDEIIVPGDSENAEFAEETERWITELLKTADSLFGGTCMYILRSGDPSFARMQLSKNQKLQDLMKRINSNPIEVNKMSLVIKWPTPMPTVVAGKSVTLDVELHQDNLEGGLARVTGIATASLMLPRTPEDYEYPDGIDPIAMDAESSGEDVDGKLQITFNIPDVKLPGPMAGNVKINFLTFPNTGDTIEKVSPPIIIFPSMQVQQETPVVLPNVPNSSNPVPVVNLPYITPSPSVPADPTPVSTISGIRVDRLDMVLGQTWDTLDNIQKWVDYLRGIILLGKGERTDLPERPR